MLLSVLFVAFIHKSHSDGQSRSDGQKMKKIHVNKALGPPLDLLRGKVTSQTRSIRDVEGTKNKAGPKISVIFNDRAPCKPLFKTYT